MVGYINSDFGYHFALMIGVYGNSFLQITMLEGRFMLLDYIKML